MTDDFLPEQSPEQSSESYSGPLFLYISPARLIIASIVSFGLYEAYWIYKNWQYIKKRDSLNIRPFWRGIFGVFFCHSLLKRIHGDPEARAIQSPTFAAGGLATGWVVFVVAANIISRAPSIEASLISGIIPSYLCFVPVQKYINAVAADINPEPKFHGWSAGQIICLAFGIVVWLLLFIGLAA